MSENLFIVVSHGRYISDDTEIPGQLPVLQELEGTDGWGLMDVRNFFTVYVFEVKESISPSFTKLPCSGDRENPSQLPVSEVLQGTVDWVLWISVTSSFLTFSMSWNLFFVVSHGRYIRMTSKFQVNFRFCKNSKVLTVGSHGFT